MARYQVILAYDGTNFKGFQRQASSARSRTIQGTVETALSRLGWQGRSVLYAGRTDTGVHAYGQVIAFDLVWNHSLDELQAAFNATLPPDIVVREIHLADPCFHPRYDAVARKYQYRLFCQPIRDPFRERYAWRVWPEVVSNEIQQVALHLIGSYDFSSFGVPTRVGGTTVRNVMKAEWRKEDDTYTFEIVADAFLYHMVRRLVSFQVSVGQGRLNPEAILECLNRRSPSLVKGIAPSQGLVLMEVIYPKKEYNK